MKTITIALMITVGLMLPLRAVGLDMDMDGETDELISYRTEWNNEDINRNLILDTLEDVNLDGQLTPPSTSAGSLPAILRALVSSATQT